MVEKSKIHIDSMENDIVLASINKDDLEPLRKWKNANRGAFFHKEIITESGQKKWYDKYTSAENDYIFMVLYNSVKIGCLGYREMNGLIDIYNVILGKNEFGKKGLMGSALRILCSYLYDNIKGDITTRVLYENPAKSWYIKNGFIKIKRAEDYLLLKLDINNFCYLKYNLKIS